MGQHPSPHTSPSVTVKIRQSTGLYKKNGPSGGKSFHPLPWSQLGHQEWEHCITRGLCGSFYHTPQHSLTWVTGLMGMTTLGSHHLDLGVLGLMGILGSLHPNLGVMGWWGRTTWALSILTLVFWLMGKGTLGSQYPNPGVLDWWRWAPWALSILT